MKNYKLAIVGATGVVGRTALKVLKEFDLPIAEYAFFASKKSAGQKIHFKEKEYIIQELTEQSFDSGFDYAIFSAGGDTAKHFAPIAVSKGCTVIDNSSAFRMEADVPLVVPEVNPQDALQHHGIIANPNCSTIQAVVPLKVMNDICNIKRIVYSTYQAVSGAGKQALDDLKNDTCYKFPYPIHNNCLPHIDVFLENGYTKEEMKMINETRKILGKPDLKITATTVRVPVENSHSESINVEFEQDFDLTQIIHRLKSTKGIIVQDDITHNIYPLATHSTGHNEVFIGRIRRDESIDYGLNFWCVADNIRKGAATNAVQILELLIKNKA